MDDRPLFRSRGAVVAMLIVAIFVTFAFLRSVDQAESSARPDSSFSTGPLGTKAFAELLRTTGFDVVQVRVPVAESAPDPGSTVVLVNARIDGADEAALASFVSSGGRLVMVESWFFDDFDPVLSLIPGGSFEEQRVVFPELDGPMVIDLPVPARAYASNTELLPLMASADGVLAGSKAIGDGRVLMVADSRLIENRYLGRADNAAIAVGLVGDKSRPVHILEYPHGFTRAEGLAAIPLRWRWVFALVAVAGLVWMWGRGRQLGTPDRQHRTLPPPRVEYVNSMASSLARTGDLGGALAPLRRRLEIEIHAASPGGTGDDPAAAESLAMRFGLEAADVHRARRTSNDPEDAMAVGRVLAALRQSRVRRGG